MSDRNENRHNQRGQQQSKRRKRNDGSIEIPAVRRQDMPVNGAHKYLSGWFGNVGRILDQRAGGSHKAWGSMDWGGESK